MQVFYKPTQTFFTVKKVRKNGKLELQNGTVIPLAEMQNYEIVK